jgi:anaerobic magnesium-protoporphyrin IX monomethyl ester cyclase
MADRLKILFVQHELFTWTRAKMWGYNWHVGLEEGLKAANVDFFTLVTPWIRWAKDLCAGKTFDQVWINDITHMFEPGGCGGTELKKEDLEWLASLAPVRVGFVIESLEYSNEEHDANPALAYARSMLEASARYMTHIMTIDEKDRPCIDDLCQASVSWFIPSIPERFITKKITLPPRQKPVFRGTPYGERARWLDMPILKHLINREPSADNFSELPGLFDNLQVLAQKTVSDTSFDPTLYEKYLHALRKIRSQSFGLYLDSLVDGSAVISLPSLGKVYTGTTYEGMASGRPVIVYRIKDRPLLESAFEEGKEILLYSKDNPGCLAEHIERVLQDPEYGMHIAEHARDKLLQLHTTERRVRQILDWITTGQEPTYTMGELNSGDVVKGNTAVLNSHSIVTEEVCRSQSINHSPCEGGQMVTPKVQNGKLRILLISPPYARFLGLGNCRFPLSLGTLGTMSSTNGHEVAIYDADFDKDLIGKSGTYEYTFSSQGLIRSALENGGHPVWKEIERTIRRFNPDVVGITTMTSKYPMALRVAEISKSVSPDITVVVGGHHSSIFGPKLVENRNIDFAVIGEGEMTFLELINRLTEPRQDFSHIKGLVYKYGAQVVSNGPRELLPNLDILPITDRNLMINNGYVSENNIMTSRGCPFNCSYCGAQVIWKRKVRRRSVANIVKEIEYLFERGSSRVVNFWDDTFTSDRRYVNDLTSSLRKFDGLTFSCITRLDVIDQPILENLKSAGCSMILFGVESGNDEILKRIDKKMTRDLIRKQTALVNATGIPWLGFFIMGYPGETKEQILQTLSFMKELDPTYAEINIFNPLPGTKIWNELEDQNLVSSDLDFSKHSQSSTENFFLRNDLSREKFKELALFMAREFDTHNRNRNGN